MLFNLKQILIYITDLRHSIFFVKEIQKTAIFCYCTSCSIFLFFYKFTELLFNVFIQQLTLKLTTVDPQERSTWRSGVRSAMPAASQLPGKGPTDVDDAPYDDLFFIQQKASH